VISATEWATRKRDNERLAPVNHSSDEIATCFLPLLQTTE
jgi:hypothetical protein